MALASASLSSAFSLYIAHTFSRSSSKPSNHLSLKYTNTQRFISTEKPSSRTPPPFSSYPVLNSYRDSRDLNDDVYRNYRRSVSKPSVSAGQETQHQQFSIPQTAAEETVTSSLKSLMHVYKEAILIGDERTVYEVEDMIYMLEKEKNELSQKVLALSTDVSSGKEKQLRVQADFDNYRKRVEKERLGVRNDARGEVIESLLPMVDSFERAKQQVKLETEMEKKIDTSYQGIYKQFVEIMRSLQVSAVPTVGRPFDPSMHEAIAREESYEFKEGIIIQEFRRGFYLGDRLLRPAMVKVSSGPGQKKPDQSSVQPQFTSRSQ